MEDTHRLDSVIIVGSWLEGIYCVHSMASERVCYIIYDWLYFRELPIRSLYLVEDTHRLESLNYCGVLAGGDILCTLYGVRERMLHNLRPALFQGVVGSPY